MSTDASKAPTTNLSDLVKGMLDRPFERGRVPREHSETIETQQLFAHSLFEEILRKVANGESVKIKNVGTFSLRMTQPTARNPSKNEVVEVKDRKRLRFVASSSSVRTLNK